MDENVSSVTEVLKKSNVTLASNSLVSPKLLKEVPKLLEERPYVPTETEMFGSIFQET